MTKSKGLQKPQARFRRLEIRQLISTTRFVEAVELTEEWWAQNITTVESYLPLRCSVCDFEPPSASIVTFEIKKSANCFCNNGARWSSEGGRVRLLKLLSETRFEPLAQILDPDAWSKSWITGQTALTYCIPIRCKECLFEPKHATVQNFLSNLSTDCNCRWKTQRLVREFMAASIPNLLPSVEVVFEGLVPGVKSRASHGRQRLMPFDVLLVDRETQTVVFAVEVDGLQHFTDGRLGTTKIKNRTTMENDLDKEIGCVEHGIPLLRLYQDDIWKDAIPWKDVLLYGCKAAVAKELAPVVHRQPDQSLYTSGKYACMRRGTIVEV
tara:strand:- start:90 stop:1064 length:975 start_codon:yes stop_codon:yes gene_type:complete